MIMETINSAIEKVSFDKVILMAFGSTIWNWITNSQSGTIIANITGILILLLIIRKFIFSIVEDISKLRGKKVNDYDFKDELQLTDREP